MSERVSHSFGLQPSSVSWSLRACFVQRSRLVSTIEIRKEERIVGLCDTFQKYLKCREDRTYHWVMWEEERKSLASAQCKDPQIQSTKRKSSLI